MPTVDTPEPVIVPVIESLADDPHALYATGPDDPVRDEFLDPLAVAYSFGPPFGERLVTYADLNELGLSHRKLRRLALNTLEEMATGVAIHGQPPVLMLSFEGIESSLLLVDELWEKLAESVPGELIVGVPARDVVFVTGLDSPQGVEKVQRGCERMFFAGGDHLLLPDLLVRREGGWELY